MPNSERRFNFFMVTAAVCLAFLVFGISDGARGPAIPRMQAEYAMSEWQLGLLLALNSIGYLLTCMYTAAVARKLGIKTCMVAGLLFVAAAGVLICFSVNYMTLAGAFFVLNLGYGMLEISLGVAAATAFTENTGAMMNLAHFFYGAGAVFAPVISTSLMAARFGGTVLGWRYMYLILLSSAFIPMAPALIGRVKQRGNTGNKPEFVLMLKKKEYWLIVMVLALGVICEAGVAAWFANYLEKAHSFTGERAALWLTLFFACFTVSRLIFGPAIDRIGFVNSLAVMTAFAGVMIVSGVLLKGAGTVLIIVAGAGVAPVFPTVMAAIAKLFSDAIDTAMTAVMTAMGIIMAPANLLIGSIINRSRLAFTAAYGDAGVGMAYSAGFLFFGICCFGSAVFAMVLRRRLKLKALLV